MKRESNTSLNEQLTLERNTLETGWSQEQFEVISTHAALYKRKTKKNTTKAQCTEQVSSANPIETNIQ